MDLTRRLLLAAPAGLLAGAAPASATPESGGIRLHSDRDPPVLMVAESADAEVYRLWIAGHGDPIELPALRARRAAILPIAGREVLALAFAADLVGAGTQDLVALIGWDGARLRILGIETLSWQRAAGPTFRMHLAASDDRRHLQLGCVAVMARPVTRPFRLSWTDLLGWREEAPLADAAARPPLVGSWQAELAMVRGRIAALLATPRTSLSLDDLAPTGILQQFGCMAGR